MPHFIMFENHEKKFQNQIGKLGDFKIFEHKKREKNQKCSNVTNPSHAF